MNQAKHERSETIALQALSYHLGEPSRIAHFLGETGFTPDQIRQGAASREILEAALAVVVADEANLWTFAANSGLEPGEVMQAFEMLSTDDGRTTPQQST